MAENTWKPIESAPKDGTRILLWLPKYDVVVSGCWAEIPGEHDGPHTFYEAFDDWCIDNDLYIMDDPPDCYPTHWLDCPGVPIDKNGNQPGNK